MRANVFTDKSLASEAGRFVWLEIDTERPVNAPLRKQLGIRALPTFYVLDPADESIAIRWVGGASLDQLKKILADGQVAVAHGDGGSGAAPDTLFARAE